MLTYGQKTSQDVSYMTSWDNDKNDKMKVYSAEYILTQTLSSSACCLEIHLVLSELILSFHQSRTIVRSDKLEIIKALN